MTANATKGTFPGMKMHAATAATLAMLHVALVAGSIHLHTPHDHSRAHNASIADLPAYLHHHDYRFDRGSDIDRWTDADCIGCRLERTPAAPTTAGSIESGGSDDPVLTPAGLSREATTIPQPPSRAPPTA